jgi:hypothetical protein
MTENSDLTYHIYTESACSVCFDTPINADVGQGMTFACFNQASTFSDNTLIV